MPVSPKKDSAATTLPKICGVAMAIPEPNKISTNPKTPKGAGGVADSNRVYFDSLEPPQLLPDGLISISRSVTEIPFENPGVVPVQHIFDINVTYTANVHTANSQGGFGCSKPKKDQVDQNSTCTVFLHI